MKVLIFSLNIMRERFESLYLEINQDSMHNLTKIDELLTEFISKNPGASRQEIEEIVWKNYGREGAIFILDMSGFSRTTKSHGIVYYLSMVKKMQRVVEPIVNTRSGRLVKFEADNAFAFFETPDQAVQAAIDIKVAIDAANRKDSDDLDIQVSVGIDYGKFLFLEENDDFFGDPVNVASKLGEDIASNGEILVSETAFTMIPDFQYPTETMTYKISGIEINAYKILYPMLEG